MKNSIQKSTMNDDEAKFHQYHYNHHTESYNDDCVTSFLAYISPEILDFNEVTEFKTRFILYHTCLFASS